MGMAMPAGMPGGMGPYTPYVPMVPGGMPPGGMPGVMPAGYAFTPAAASGPLPGGLPPQAAPPPGARFQNPKEKLPWDQMENVRFAEGEDCTCSLVFLAATVITPDNPRWPRAEPDARTSHEGEDGN